MSFTPAQISALDKPLYQGNVKARKGGGNIALSYIESHHAIREANRIFGFDGWSSETVDMVCVSDKPGEIFYKARVRVTVYAGERTIIREGYGLGSGKFGKPFDQHELAIKEAESDAQKRALRHFGDQFGLALYDKEQANVTGVDDPSAAISPVAAKEEPEPVATKSTSALVVALENTAAAMKARPSISARAQAVKPKTQTEPTIGDSASVRAAILLALDFCQTRDHALAFSNNNGQKSDKWPLMSKADQDVVLKAVKEKFADISAKAKQKGAVA